MVPIIITAIIIMAAVTVLLAIRQHLHLKAKAKECAKEVQVLRDKLKRLSDPSHLLHRRGDARGQTGICALDRQNLRTIRLSAHLPKKPR